MSINDFRRDLQFSQEMRDRYLSPFYGKYAYQGRYVYVDKSKCSTLIQKQLAVDTLFQKQSNVSLCVEEKIERRFRGNLALETESCTTTSPEIPGWMKYGEADMLLYAFCHYGNRNVVGLDVYTMNFRDLKSWFWQVQEKYCSFTMQTTNRTRFRIVPLRDIYNAIGYHKYLCTDKGVSHDEAC